MHKSTAWIQAMLASLLIVGLVGTPLPSLAQEPGSNNSDPSALAQVYLPTVIQNVASAAYSSAAVRAGPPPKYFVDEGQLPFDALAGVETQRLWGIHNGAGFRIEVPANWNGDLFVWAHGYRGTGLELTVDNPPFREWLVINGFAWAASSYSRNDYDVATGAQDTHALTQYFTGRFAKPKHVYIAGVSMGGHITGVSIEQWSNTYHGALPLCGVMGDYALFDFFLDFNLVAQAQAGIAAEFPPPDNYLSTTVPAVKLALAPGTYPFLLNEKGTQFKAAIEQLSGGERPLFDQGFLFWSGALPPQFLDPDFLFGLGMGDGTLPRSKGVSVENVNTVYQFDSDPALSPEEAQLNAAVLRITHDPQGRHKNGLSNVPPINGNIRIP
ncbi:MAG: hypothetical protein H3C34_24795, partial [Caldilineaceae bacterium]|nr:hypothetical protein [Caldilineaceae bacterium]